MSLRKMLPFLMYICRSIRVSPKFLFTGLTISMGLFFSFLSVASMAPIDERVEQYKGENEADMESWQSKISWLKIGSRGGIKDGLGILKKSKMMPVFWKN